MNTVRRFSRSRMRVMVAVTLACSLWLIDTPLSAAADGGEADVKRSAGPASGQWRGMVSDESDSVQLVIDVGTLDGEQWIGEIDIAKYGVEGYPIEVDVDGAHMKLGFWSTMLDGEVSSDGRRFVAIGSAGDDEEETVVLHRAGDPQFSALRLEMESATDDPGAVQVLGPDGRELRESFNQAKDKVRLVMLLAPT
jgi:hypothetical protein